MKHICAILVWGVAALALLPAAAGAQGPALTLNVPHMKQEATQLCWAALVSQALFQNPASSRPRQCDLVNRLNEIRGQEPGDCCGGLDRPGCNITANHLEIQSLLTQFGMKVEQVNPPSTPEEVHAYLASGRVLLVGVQTTPTDNHLYLVRGLTWENGRAILTVNDPYYNSSAKIPFTEARPTWHTALAVG